MPRSQSKSDRVAFIACTSVAIAVIAGMWIWNVRALVEQGVSGAKQVFTDVSQTATDVKIQSSPDPAATEAIKAGIHAVLKNAAPAAPAEEAADAQATVDAVAQLMSEKLVAGADADATTADTEPKQTE